MKEELEEKITERAKSDQGTDTKEITASDEALLAINLLLQFAFREVQSSGPVRRFLLDRINKEMQEGISKGFVSAIIKGLKVALL